MPSPSCTITVTFFDKPTPSFGYFCVSQPPAWQVGLDGTICPSTRTRSIQLDLESAPVGAEFLGIRIATSPGALQNTNEPYFNDPDETHITVTRATSAKPSITLDDDAATPSVRVWYALGVTFNGVAHWDDPKIYNPPVE